MSVCDFEESFFSEQLLKDLQFNDELNSFEMVHCSYLSN